MTTLAKVIVAVILIAIGTVLGIGGNWACLVFLLLGAVFWVDIISNKDN